jgi:hypothetical protein
MAKRIIASRTFVFSRSFLSDQASVKCFVVRAISTWKRLIQLDWTQELRMTQTRFLFHLVTPAADAAALSLSLSLFLSLSYMYVTSVFGFLGPSSIASSRSFLSLPPPLFPPPSLLLFLVSCLLLPLYQRQSENVNLIYAKKENRQNE